MQKCRKKRILITLCIKARDVVALSTQQAQDKVYFEECALSQSLLPAGVNTWGVPKTGEIRRERRQSANRGVIVASAKTGITRCSG